METQVITPLSFRGRLFGFILERLGSRQPLPPLGAVCYLDVFVAGEAEVDEPFTIEQPSAAFSQQRNPPPVVLDQVVVGGEDVGNFLLV